MTYYYELFCYKKLLQTVCNHICLSVEAQGGKELVITETKTKPDSKILCKTEGCLKAPGVGL